MCDQVPLRLFRSDHGIPSDVPFMKGEFHWHEHHDEDEFFFVVDGRLIIDVEEQDSVNLGPKQGFTVPKGVMHRTRAPDGVVVLMVEGAGVVPTGD